MTNEERERRLSAIEFGSIDLGLAYERLGSSLARVIGSVRSFRPDAVEAFFERWRAQRDRAVAETSRMEEEIFEANAGVTNDGPDRWTTDLDALGRNGNKKGK